MSTIPRNRLVLFGASWGLLLALMPATFAFDGFALSPFLLAALLLAVLAACGRASRRAEGAGRGWGVSGIGVLQRIVAATIAALTIWLALTATGFSPAAPGRVLALFGDPGIFLQNVLAAFVGLLLSPLVGSAILRLVRGEGDGASRGVAVETG